MNAYADVFEDGRIKLSGNFLAFGHKSFYVTDADLESLAAVMAAWKLARPVAPESVQERIDEYLRKDVE
jgi:hypothetical protein